MTLIFGPRIKSKLNKAAMKDLMTSPGITREQYEEYQRKKRIARQAAEARRDEKYYELLQSALL